MILYADPEIKQSSFLTMINHSSNFTFGLVFSYNYFKHTFFNYPGSIKLITGIIRFY